MPGLRQRPLARLSPRAARARRSARRRSFWTWRERMYELAARLDPDSYRRLARADLRRDGARRDHRGRRVPLPAPRPGGDPYDGSERDGPGADRGGARGRASGSRCSTPATCTAASASRSSASQRRFADGDADGLGRARRRSSTDRRRRRGSAPRSTASARSTPTSAATVAALGGGALERPLHAHVSEQPAENEACLAAYGRTPDGGARATPARSDERLHRGARHPRRPTPTSPLLGGGRLPLLPLPDDRARSRRRDRPGRAICATPGAPLALGSRLARGDRPRSRRRARSSSTSAWRRGERGRHARRRRCSRAATEHGHAALGWPEAGRIEPGALADLVTVGLDGVRLAGTTAATGARGGRVRGHRRRRRAAWSAAAARSSATARHVATRRRRRAAQPRSRRCSDERAGDRPTSGCWSPTTPSSARARSGSCATRRW